MASNMLKVKVTNVIDPLNFQGLLGDEQSLQVFEQFEDRIAEYCEREVERATAADFHAQSIPDLILVYNESLQRWLRATITSVDERDEKADVIYVDYGFSEFVSWSNIIVDIPNFVREVQIISWLCQVVDVMPIAGTGWISRAITKFRELVLNKTCDVQLCGGVDAQNKVTVDILLDYHGKTKSLSDILLEDGLAREADKNVGKFGVQNGGPSKPGVYGSLSAGNIPGFDLQQLQKSQNKSRSKKSNAPDIEEQMWRQKAGDPEAPYEQSDLFVGQAPAESEDVIGRIHEQVRQVQLALAAEQTECDAEVDDRNRPRQLTTAGRGRGRKTHSPHSTSQGSDSSSSSPAHRHRRGSGPDDRRPGSPAQSHHMTSSRSQKLQTEYDWHSTKLGQDILQALEENKPIEERLESVAILVYQGGSKLLGLPGPSALHVGLLTALRHTIFNWDSCNKDATKIVSTFQRDDDFGSVISEVLWTLHGAYIKIGGGKRTLQLSKAYCELLGMLYVDAQIWDNSTSKHSMDVCILNMLEKWAVFNKRNNQMHAVELMELYTDCLYNFLAIAGDLVEDFLPTEVQNLLLEVREKVLCDVIPEKVRNKLLDLLVLREHQWSRKPTFPPGQSGPEGDHQRDASTDTTSKCHVVTQTPKKRLEDKSTQTLDESTMKPPSPPAQRLDSYYNVKKMLNELNMMDLFTMFESNALRDGVLCVEFSELKEVLKDCGLLPGQLLEIKTYLSKKSKEDLMMVCNSSASSETTSDTKLDTQCEGHEASPNVTYNDTTTKKTIPASCKNNCETQETSQKDVSSARFSSASTARYNAEDPKSRENRRVTSEHTRPLDTKANTMVTKSLETRSAEMKLAETMSVETRSMETRVMDSTKRKDVAPSRFPSDNKSRRSPDITGPRDGTRSTSDEMQCRENGKNKDNYGSKYSSERERQTPEKTGARQNVKYTQENAGSLRTAKYSQEENAGSLRTAKYSQEYTSSRESLKFSSDNAGAVEINNKRGDPESRYIVDNVDKYTPPNAGTRNPVKYTAKDPQPREDTKRNDLSKYNTDGRDRSYQPRDETKRNDMPRYNIDNRNTSENINWRNSSRYAQKNIGLREASESTGIQRENTGYRERYTAGSGAARPANSHKEYRKDTARYSPVNAPPREPTGQKNNTGFSKYSSDFKRSQDARRTGEHPDSYDTNKRKDVSQSNAADGDKQRDFSGDYPELKYTGQSDTSVPREYDELGDPVVTSSSSTLSSVTDYMQPEFVNTKESSSVYDYRNTYMEPMYGTPEMLSVVAAEQHYAAQQPSNQPSQNAPPTQALYQVPNNQRNSALSEFNDDYLEPKYNKKKSASNPDYVHSKKAPLLPNPDGCLEPKYQKKRAAMLPIPDTNKSVSHTDNVLPASEYKGHYSGAKYDTRSRLTEYQQDFMEPKYMANMSIGGVKTDSKEDRSDAMLSGDKGGLSSLTDYRTDFMVDYTVDKSDLSTDIYHSPLEGRYGTNKPQVKLITPDLFTCSGQLSQDLSRTNKAAGINTDSPAKSPTVSKSLPSMKQSPKQDNSLAALYARHIEGKETDVKHGDSTKKDVPDDHNHDHQGELSAAANYLPPTPTTSPRDTQHVPSSDDKASGPASPAIKENAGRSYARALSHMDEPQPMTQAPQKQNAGGLVSLGRISNKSSSKNSSRAVNPVK